MVQEPNLGDASGKGKQGAFIHQLLQTGMSAGHCAVIGPFQMELRGLRDAT